MYSNNSQRLKQNGKVKKRLNRYTRSILKYLPIRDWKNKGSALVDTNDKANDEHGLPAAEALAVYSLHSTVYLLFSSF